MTKLERLINKLEENREKQRKKDKAVELQVYVAQLKVKAKIRGRYSSWFEKSFKKDRALIEQINALRAADTNANESGNK